MMIGKKWFMFLLMFSLNLNQYNKNMITLWEMTMTDT